MGYRKSDTHNPAKLLARGVALAQHLGCIPGAKHLGSHTGMPSYSKICQVFGSFAAFQQQVTAALSRESAVEKRRGGPTMQSALDYLATPGEHLGCNMGAIMDGPCTCASCHAWATDPQRHCTCGVAQQGEANGVVVIEHNCPACQGYHRARSQGAVA